MIKSEVIIKSEKILEYIQMTLLRRGDVSDISTWYSTVLQFTYPSVTIIETFD